MYYTFIIKAGIQMEFTILSDSQWDWKKDNSKI